LISETIYDWVRGKKVTNIFKLQCSRKDTIIILLTYACIARLDIIERE